MKTSEFVLPEIWHIKITEENEYLVNKWFDSKYVNLRPYIHLCGMVYDHKTKNITKEFNDIDIVCENGYTFGSEITFDQFKEHVLKEIPKPEYDPKDVAFNQRKVIGYKLIKPEYKEAVKAIINRKDWFHNFDINLVEKGFNFGYTDEKDPLFCDSINYAIKKAGVLSLWFEPVYEKESITLKSGVKLSEEDIAEVTQLSI